MWACQEETVSTRCWATWASMRRRWRRDPSCSPSTHSPPVDPTPRHKRLKTKLPEDNTEICSRLQGRGDFLDRTQRAPAIKKNTNMSDYPQIKNFRPSEGTTGRESPRGRKATCHIMTKSSHSQYMKNPYEPIRQDRHPFFLMGKRHEQFTKDDTRVADKRRSASLAIRGCKRNHAGRPAQQNGCDLKARLYQVPARMLGEGRPAGDRNPRHCSDRQFSGSPKEHTVRDLCLQA